MLSVPRPPKLHPSPPSSHLVPPSSCSLLLSIYLSIHHSRSLHQSTTHRAQSLSPDCLASSHQHPLNCQTAHQNNNTIPLACPATPTTLHEHGYPQTLDCSPVHPRLYDNHLQYEAVYRRRSSAALHLRRLRPAARGPRTLRQRRQ